MYKSLVTHLSSNINNFPIVTGKFQFHVRQRVTHSFHLTLWPRTGFTSDQPRWRRTGCPWCLSTRWATQGNVTVLCCRSTQSGLLLPAYCVACAQCNCSVYYRPYSEVSN